MSVPSVHDTIICLVWIAIFVVLNAYWMDRLQKNDATWHSFYMAKKHTWNKALTDVTEREVK